ncbi:unnamed protein product [Acanthoscelides obtectus]|uniref:Uncharacterized protein n=2 Tax=Acanthoscelides obtectus TaxID=200917 RepID=A0A9P0MFM7_ACAOB|nr:unnamed protein product [Acanthoscelides obtectus]CAK1666814.1 hypothetical protein AOBTE_LOCUS25501 [Acanthoscelides obtectus]
MIERNYVLPDLNRTLFQDALKKRSRGIRDSIVHARVSSTRNLTGGMLANPENLNECVPHFCESGDQYPGECKEPCEEDFICCPICNCFIQLQGKEKVTCSTSCDYFQQRKESCPECECRLSERPYSTDSTGRQYFQSSCKIKWSDDSVNSGRKSSDKSGESWENKHTVETEHSVETKHSVSREDSLERRRSRESGHSSVREDSLESVHSNSRRLSEQTEASSGRRSSVGSEKSAEREDSPGKKMSGGRKQSGEGKGSEARAGKLRPANKKDKCGEDRGNFAEFNKPCEDCRCDSTKRGSDDLDLTEGIKDSVISRQLHLRSKRGSARVTDNTEEATDSVINRKSIKEEETKLICPDSCKAYKHGISCLICGCDHKKLREKSRCPKDGEKGCEPGCEYFQRTGVGYPDFKCEEVEDILQLVIDKAQDIVEHGGRKNRFGSRESRRMFTYEGSMSSTKGSSDVSPKPRRRKSMQSQDSNRSSTRSSLASEEKAKGSCCCLDWEDLSVMASCFASHEELVRCLTAETRKQSAASNRNKYTHSLHKDSVVSTKSRSFSTGEQEKTDKDRKGYRSNMSNDSLEVEDVPKKRLSSGTKKGTKKAASSSGKKKDGTSGKKAASPSGKNSEGKDAFSKDSMKMSVECKPMKLCGRGKTGKTCFTEMSSKCRTVNVLDCINECFSRTTNISGADVDCGCYDNAAVVDKQEKRCTTAGACDAETNTTESYKTPSTCAVEQDIIQQLTRISVEIENLRCCSQSTTKILSEVSIPAPNSRASSSLKSVTFSSLAACSPCLPSSGIEERRNGSLNENEIGEPMKKQVGEPKDEKNLEVVSKSVPVNVLSGSGSVQDWSCPCTGRFGFCDCDNSNVEPTSDLIRDDNNKCIRKFGTPCAGRNSDEEIRSTGSLDRNQAAEPTEKQIGELKDETVDPAAQEVNKNLEVVSTSVPVNNLPDSGSGQVYSCPCTGRFGFCDCDNSDVEPIGDEEIRRSESLDKNQVGEPKQKQVGDSKGENDPVTQETNKNLKVVSASVNNLPDSGTCQEPTSEPPKYILTSNDNSELMKKLGTPCAGDNRDEKVASGGRCLSFERRVEADMRKAGTIDRDTQVGESCLCIAHESYSKEICLKNLCYYDDCTDKSVPRSISSDSLDSDCKVKSVKEKTKLCKKHLHVSVDDIYNMSKDKKAQAQKSCWCIPNEGFQGISIKNKMDVNFFGVLGTDTHGYHYSKTKRYKKRGSSAIFQLVSEPSTAESDALSANGAVNYNSNKRRGKCCH